jgi:putative ATPase
MKNQIAKPSLFTNQSQAPLADRLRPQCIDQVVGQGHLLDEGKPLSRMLQSGKLSSLILWGPPGCGKTTIAQLLAQAVDMEYQAISAVFSGVADLKKVFAQAQTDFDCGRKTLLFVDEIHRFNRTQQDSFLPFVEKGIVTLVGATTENPSFELNGALLSRCQVLTLKRLDALALEALLQRVESKVSVKLLLTADAREALKSMADGDGRSLLNMAEVIVSQEFTEELTPDLLQDVISKRATQYDKSREEHYNLISALHKSLRGSDPDAALYWFARMVEGGEDPLYIARRLIRFASEDIGLADPQALPQTIAAVEAYERLGSPEGELAILQALVYLATAPKSNALYLAQKAAVKAAKSSGSLMPPKEILNAPTQLMKNENYGKGYIYDHDTPEGFSGQNYFPEEMGRQEFYSPVERGFERDIRKRLAYWTKLRG